MRRMSGAYRRFARLKTMQSRVDDVDLSFRFSLARRLPHRILAVLHAMNEVCRRGKWIAPTWKRLISDMAARCFDGDGPGADRNRWVVSLAITAASVYVHAGATLTSDQMEQKCRFDTMLKRHGALRTKAHGSKQAVPAAASTSRTRRLISRTPRPREHAGFRPKNAYVTNGRRSIDALSHTATLSRTRWKARFRHSRLENDQPAHVAELATRAKDKRRSDIAHHDHMFMQHGP